MGEFKRKSDDRRIFTSDFKRATVERVRSGAATLAEVSRELEIAPGILRNWMRLVERGGRAAVEGAGFRDLRVLPDLRGIPRVLVATRP